MSISELAKQVHQNARSKGFHDDSQEVFIRTTVANIHGEVSEFWEAYRKNSLDDLCDKKGCSLTNAEEELADIIIRTLDTAERLGINIETAILTKHAYNLTRPFKHGGKLA